ncbi:cytidine deaminase [Anoxynatronum buryatiense]|uniref:Cytidine deaminase n=1 Tax=Anoxynatronum buryatiense TaxID=489973 RepID=A0AA45WST4_9CLOT|nr:cytidine deaminase [Anoxynatronum buryatiense]SMP39443.1 cytidine deaminase [Anoxynatronum buryatiense]
MTHQDLIQIALEVRENAYVPYSHFKVGAALLGVSGKVYTGCNVECASYGGTNCAERTAIFKAVSEGERRFKTIAVVGDPNAYTFPCGICRQVMVEFGKELEIIVAKTPEDYRVYTMNDILPHSFTPDDLENSREGAHSHDL